MKHNGFMKGYIMRDRNEIIKKFNTITDLDARLKYLLQLDNKTNDLAFLPAVLKRLKASERLTYIRHEDSSAKEYGDITNPELKSINYIIYCDLYLEHLMASKYSQPKCSPDLTDQKIEVIENARKILVNQEEDDDEVPQSFYEHLLDNKTLLETRRDTQFTSFLKSVGLMWLVNLAYSSFFVKTDGKVLIEKIEAIEEAIDKKP
jgi:hypothetical protein